jgi:lipopolysaccharide/colanic/teichoic acid biosynthesis glycosyltransferase
MTSPLLAIIILAIKIEDHGPIFIRQERYGKHGKKFKLYKFRSMIVLGADGQAETGTAVWATVNDPRVTRVGKITRKLHLDELGQMINLIKGDLTLVGPRPERSEFVAELEKQIPYYFIRHTIQPGFTGWAQIKFRYARTVMDSQEKFEYDLYYLKNRNFFLDIGIILKTVQIIFTH